MGCRFTLENANAIANLTFGNIYSCYETIISSEQEFFGFASFLENLHQNLYSKNDNFFYEIKKIKKILHDVEIFEKNNFPYEMQLLPALERLSHFFSRCRVKSLLLPKIIDRDNNNNDFMLSRKILHELVEIHPEESCLILQPQEVPADNKVNILNAFPNFEVALRQMDSWPGVFLWDNDDYLFIPVENRQELIKIFLIARYENQPFSRIRNAVSRKKKGSHYYFHLSDLHFGGNEFHRERRLKALITKELNRLKGTDNIDFIITGDVVDNPTKNNFVRYEDFSDFIENRISKSPLLVLGNHDISSRGLSFFSRIKRLFGSIKSLVSANKSLFVDERNKLIFLLFNSNTGGDWAQGQIGMYQMAEMGNQLDSIRNLESYKLIAVLHHHIVAIPRPDVYDRRWYERIFPNTLYDEALKLIDAKIFIEWLKQRNVKLVIHGHKHIPFVTEKDGIHVISCGSSTGHIAHKDTNKTYMSYNIIKIEGNSVLCTQHVEEIIGAGPKSIRSVGFKI